MSDNSRLSNIKDERLKKLKALQDKGVNPYPSESDRRQAVKQARDLMNQEVTVVGRIRAKRGHGSMSFMDLEDESGKIQLLLRKDNLSESFEIVKLLDVGDFIQVSGKVMKTQAGEVTVDTSNVTILSKSIRPLPDKWHGLSDVEERFRQRYVDLVINPDVRKFFHMRAKMIKNLRNYLDDKGFLEVSTPVLQPIYGGTTALPFITHHNALDVDLYLRIADELYLKRLIVGGFEKVYEFGIDFRNEGIDRWHNPEFTQLEFYEAYTDYEDLMSMTEEMLSSMVKNVTGSYELEYGDHKINFKSPWKRIAYKDAILNKTDIDIEKEDSVEKLKNALKEKDISVELSEKADVFEILDTLFKHTVRPTIQDPTFITDYPAFMKPLAKKKQDDESKVEAFQVVVAGTEIINAYTELNDPVDQRTRWEDEEKRGKEGVTEHQVVDEDYLRALEYGMPPTAGWGMGIERVLAILTNSHSIKEVILFPTLRPDRTHSQYAKADVAKQVADISNEPVGLINSKVKQKHPNMSFGVAVFKNVKISKKSNELEKHKKEVLKKIGKLSTDDISSFSTIIAYRDLFKSFGIDWHSRRPSPDALLRRIALDKGLYTVNTLVDAYNLAVLESKIGLGAFDASQLQLPVELRFAKEGETIYLLGDRESTKVKEGELVYADQSRLITLDLNYRDTDKTKIVEKTKDVILFTDGAPGISDEEVMNGLELGIKYITRHCGGTVERNEIVR